MISKMRLGSCSILVSLCMFSANAAFALDTGKGVTECTECVSDGFLTGMQTCCTTISGNKVCSVVSCTLTPPADPDTLPFYQLSPRKILFPLLQLSPNVEGMLP